MLAPARATLAKLGYMHRLYGGMRAARLEFGQDTRRHGRLHEFHVRGVVLLKMLHDVLQPCDDAGFDQFGGARFGQRLLCVDADVVKDVFHRRRRVTIGANELRDSSIAV